MYKYLDNGVSDFGGLGTLVAVLNTILSLMGAGSVLFWDFGRGFAVVPNPHALG